MFDGFLTFVSLTAFPKDTFEARTGALKLPARKDKDLCGTIVEALGEEKGIRVPDESTGLPTVSAVLFNSLLLSSTSCW